MNFDFYQLKRYIFSQFRLLNTKYQYLKILVKLFLLSGFWGFGVLGLGLVEKGLG